MITKYSCNLKSIKSRNHNVIEYYKDWIDTDIQADLDPNRTGIVMIFQNISYNINIAASIRTHNAFLGNSVYIVGRRKYYCRGDVGTRHYEHVYHADTLQEVVEYLHSIGYKIYAVDNIMEYNPKNLLDESLPYKAAFVFGEENAGLSREEIELCDDMLYVQMYGSVRSMNVACCASVIEFEYSRQWRN